ncbi:DNA repair protein REV1-like [Hydractinia symbiolongicarpus]|uniref:DNA repair protein REV1-like n=1 Tax=Hydractinia symbiolongicarpus TaxID=13093 RepID=UPI00254B1702|nr:DNA repair protein REV1-like [Hydractinia symbiolongicarpus]
MDLNSKENTAFKQQFNKGDPKTCSDDGWAEVGGYWKSKNEKLKKQFNATIVRKSSIFDGVAIWVNGLTYPSSDELKRIMAEHGGSYIHFFSKTNVTHVIATNMPNSKIKNLKKKDKVVHPDWIVDSVQAGRLLAVDKYLLYSVAKRDGAVLKFPVQSKSHSEANLSKNNETSETSDASQSEMCNTPESMDDDFTNVDFQQDKTEAAGQPVLSKHDYSAVSKTPLKAGDDNFISEFYTHSRLHHLSMWKAELKKFAFDIQKKRKEFENKHLTSMPHKYKIIMHVDLDSFFVSVALKMNPELAGKPVAVCHSGRGNSEGKSSWSEIASCSYEARKFGLRNGMLLNKAKQLCPQLVCVPYYFDEYRNVSQKFYEILSHFTCNIEAVSCDEALLDITELVETGETILEVAENIRNEILKNTGCIASCGIGNSILIARLATKQAKPNGKCYVSMADVPEFIKHQNVKDLPGIGWAQGQKLEALNIKTCEDLQKMTLLVLQKEFGVKLGETLFNFCRGKDERGIKMDQDRKSVSAEINYGMRFTEYHEVEKFVYQLSCEVEKRLKDIQKMGTHITIKLMTRRKDAQDPSKYMGHGWCENLSRSSTLPTPTHEAKIIGDRCCSILRTLQIQAKDFRGMGIQMTKLTDVSLQTTHTKSLLEFTKPVSVEELQKQQTREKRNKETSTKKSSSLDNFMKPVAFSACEKTAETVELPPLPSFQTRHSSAGTSSSFEPPSSLSWDPAVLSELPEDIQKELKMYQAQNVSSAESKSISTKQRVSPKKKIPQSKKGSPKTNSPLTSGRGKQKRLRDFDASKYGDIRVSSRKLVSNDDQFTGTGAKANATEKQHVRTSREKDGILSPSQIDLGVVNELPDDIRDEIISKMRKTGHLSRRNKEKNRKNTDENFHLKKADQHETKFSCGRDMTETPMKKNTSSESTSPQTNQFLLSPSQLDQSFLRALPEEVRQDVISDAEKSKQRRHTPIAKSPLNVEAFNTDKDTGINRCVNSKLRCDDMLSPSHRRVNNALRCDDMLSPSQLDANVLAALPIDLQNEVMQRAEVEKKRRQRKREANTVVIPDSNHAEEEIDEPVKMIKLTQILPILHGASEYTDIKNILKQWVDEYEEPFYDDIKEIKTYLQKLLSSHNMETLFLVLKYLKRVTASLPSWQPHYNNILETTQMEMKKMYSGVLPITPFAMTHLI